MAPSYVVRRMSVRERFEAFVLFSVVLCAAAGCVALFLG